MPGPCPACCSALRDDHAEQNAFSTCPSCGGHWLPREAARRVVDGVVTVVETLRAASPRTEGDPYRAAPQHRGAARRCVECAEPMQQTYVSELAMVLDTCAPHGVWFDSGELERVARWFADSALELDSEDDPGVDPLTLALLRRRVVQPAS